MSRKAKRVLAILALVIAVASGPIAIVKAQDYTFNVLSFQCDFVAMTSDYEDNAIRAHIRGSNTRHETVTQLRYWAGIYWADLTLEDAPFDNYSIVRVTSAHGLDQVVDFEESISCGTHPTTSPKRVYRLNLPILY